MFTGSIVTLTCSLKMSARCHSCFISYLKVRSMIYYMAEGWGGEQCTAWCLTLIMAYLDEIFSDHTDVLHIHKNNHYWQLWLFVVTYFNI